MNKFKVIIAGVVFLSLFNASPCRAADTSKLEKFFLEGNYEKAVRESESLIESRSRRRDEVYYLKGLSELKLKRFGDARQSFQNILDKYPGSRKGFDAYVGIGDSYFLEDRASSALKEYNEALRRFPKDKNVTTVYSRMSDCYAKLGDKAKEEEYVKRSKGIFTGTGEIKDLQALPPISDITKTRDVPRGESGYITVQVGSFKNKKNAERVMNKLIQEGFECYVEVPAGSGDKLYRVKAGRLQSMEGAESLAAKLKRKGYSTKICSDSVCR